MSLDREVPEISVPAEYLKRRVGGARRGLGCVELGLRGGVGEANTRVRQGGGAVHQQAGGVELGARSREAPLDHLELGDRPAELPPLLRVSDRDFERRAAEPDRERADSDASFVENPFDIVEGVAVAADPIGRRNATILEHELRGVRRVQPHLLFTAAHAIAGRSARHAEPRELALAAAGEDDGEARDRAVGDELLRAREDVTVALATGTTLNTDRVRSR